LLDEVFGKGYYVQTFNRLVPWETYFASHPEYFACVHGKRIIDQLCLSRPEVLEIAVAKLKSEKAAQPAADYGLPRTCSKSHPFCAHMART